MLHIFVGDAEEKGWPDFHIVSESKTEAEWLHCPCHVDIDNENRPPLVIHHPFLAN